MYWTWFEWINDIGSVLNLLLSFVVGLVALVVAFKLTKRRLCREAAWLLALGWLGCCALAVAGLIVDLLLMRAVGWTVAQWLTYGIELLTLCSFGVMGAGLFMFRLPARGRS